jgi:hypothetical protein
LIAVLLGATAAGQSPGSIAVDGPRPLMQLVDRLEALSGVPINYEDPRYDRPAEIEDVTDRVQTAAQRSANPTARILVPRGGRLAVALPLASERPDQADVGSLLIHMRSAYETADLPGRFEIAERNGVWHVEGRGAGNNSTSVMAHRISIPRKRRGAGEFLKLLLNEVGQQAGVRVVIGSLPFVAFAAAQGDFGADYEPAATVMARLFLRLSRGTHTGASRRPRFSYRLLFDPGLKYYAFNVRAVPPVPPATQPAAPNSITPKDIDPQGGWPGSRTPN